MDLKKLLLAAVASFLAMFALSFVWHVLLMNSLYMPGEGSQVFSCFRTEPIFPIIALGYAVLACIMAYIYPKGVEGDNMLMNGLRFGVVIALLWILPMQLVMKGVTHIAPLKTTAIDVIWHMVEQGIGGIIIAYIYGKKA